MSGVHEGNREPLPEKLRFMVLAKEIDAEATYLAASVIPKSYRFVLGVQMAEAANRMAELCDLSQELYPSSAQAAFVRKKTISEAAACAKTVRRLANKAVKLGIAPAGRFEKLLSDIAEFLNCAHGLKKNVRVRGEESAEEAIAYHRREIEALQRLNS